MLEKSYIAKKCLVLDVMTSTESARDNEVPLVTQSKIQTFDYAWIIISFLISLLWFRYNSVPVFPLGLVGGVVISFMIHRIDRALGKSSYLKLSIPLSIIACFLGLLIG
jgi:hypothetical protein